MPALCEWSVSVCKYDHYRSSPKSSYIKMKQYGVLECLLVRLRFGPQQDRFTDAVEPLDITAMCVKRAKRRLKFTTQLMQQLVPALPCQLFKGNALDDYKSATFVLAKFAVSEACWLSTGLSREASGAVAAEDGADGADGAENSKGEVSM